MRFLAWSRDTIARRFATTIILSTLVTLALVRLFFVFGGDWARPDLQRSGLLGEAAGIVRVVDAAPSAIRQSLLAASAPNGVRIALYEPASPAAGTFNQADDGEEGGALMADWLGDKYRAIAFEPRDWALPIPAFDPDQTAFGPSRGVAIRLTDGSWIVFDVVNRSWGLPRSKLWILWSIFLVISVAIVSAIAARQLSRPVERLAEAIQLFGQNPNAPALAETGPRELRQVIKIFNAMQAQIQKFLTYRILMLAAISHDLRTPLTRIRLRGEFIEDAEQQQRLFRDVDEMQAMVDGALAFFRDAAVEEETTAFDLPGLLCTIANDYADQGIDIRYTGPARGVYRGQPFALKRAFTNLIENAIKYGTPPEVELCAKGEAWVLAIRDRGPGIPAEALERVFSPFYRLDKSRNRTTGGVGLGLTAAQAIIQAHGGEVTLANRPEGGLEARAVLPAQPRPAAVPTTIS